MLNVSAFDHMISEGILRYRVNAWMMGERGVHYSELEGLTGQVLYNGNVFFVTPTHGRRGMGGMDEGHPPGILITRIRENLQE